MPILAAQSKLPQPRDRLFEPLTKRNRRLPSQPGPCQGDIRLALFRIILWERLKNNLALTPRQLAHNLGKLKIVNSSGLPILTGPGTSETKGEEAPPPHHPRNKTSASASRRHRRSRLLKGLTDKCGTTRPIAKGSSGAVGIENPRQHGHPRSWSGDYANVTASA